jgi:hypothetical protein
VHLPAQQSVVFNENNINEALARAEIRDSKLTAWFRLNRRHPTARKYLYSEIPEHYTWISNETEWRRRKKGSVRVLGRIYNIAPSQKELFYLRMLLLEVRGAQSYDELLTFDQVVHRDFKSACIARGLLRDNKMWVQTMQEAVA